MAKGASAQTLLGPVARGYALAALTVVYFFNLVDRLVLSILIEPIKAELRLSDTQLGLVSGLAFIVFYSVCALPLARLADRVSRVRMISACLALWSAMTALTGLAGNFTQLFLARLGVGVGEAGCVPAAHSLIADYFPPARRALAMSLFNAGGQAGLAVGLAAAGFIASKFGWRAALWCIGLPGIPFAVLVLLTVREPLRQRRKDTVGRTQENAQQAVRGLLRRPTVRRLLFAMALVSIANLGMSQWTPAFFMRSHGLSTSEVGYWTALAFGGGAILGTVAGGLVTMRMVAVDRRWECWVPSLGYGFGGVLYLLVFLAPAVSAALVTMAAAAFAVALGSGASLSALQAVADPHRRATISSIHVILVAVVGMGVGGLAIGALSDALLPRFGTESLRYAMLIPVMALQLGAIFFWAAARSSATDRNDAEGA